jgi:ubiquinone biosynthesis UbiH/UbiF/VisC/COQ6 family hydroxylase
LTIEVDVAIVGGGLVGLSLARALAGAGLELALVDRAPPQDATAWNPQSWDARVYAISPGSEDFLTRCGAWPVEWRDRIVRVRRMQVYGDAGDSRLVLDAYETHVDHLASIVENRLLLGALWRSVRAQRGVTVLAPAQGEAVSFDAGGAELRLDHGEPVRARLLVAADGADSWLRAQAGIAVQAQAYGQTAVVANFACAEPHQGAAFQWFRRDGVVALLPLPGNRVSLVWSADERIAEALMSATPDALGERVAQVAGRALGRLEPITVAAAFPLRLVRVDRLLAPRLALVGDAAHNLHPLAGQGVNLGFQDARVLADVLHQRGGCADVGEHRLLRRYERQRREDVLLMTLATDGLKRLFNNDSRALGWVRNRGLALVERAGPIKRLFVRHALG